MNSKGQTLIEVIVVMVVGVLIIGALVFATISSLRNAQFAKNQSQATKLAQEGIERVRSGRDRNNAISGLSGVDSWSGIQPFWNYQIEGNCANISTNTNCYFTTDSSGVLTYRGSGSSIPSNAEFLAPGFQRIVIISDDGTYQTQKKITVIVSWTDFSGAHESKLTTILRKI